MPTFAGESHSGAGSDTAGCFYMFEWYTSVACPPGPPPPSGNCSVVDNIRGGTYDVSALSRPGGYNVTYDSYHVSLNVCGAVSCGRTPSAGACLLPSSANPTSQLLGTANSALHYNHGDVWLDYATTEACGVEADATSMKRVKIFFLCDVDATPDQTAGASPGQYIELKNVLGGGCEYILEYSTSLVCPPAAPQPCSVADPVTNQVYDLSPLQRSDGSAFEVEVQGTGTTVDRYVLCFVCDGVCYV